MDNHARIPPARTPRHTARRSNWLLGAIAVAAVALIPAAAVFAQATPAPFTVIETGQEFGSLQQAVDAIGDGSGTIAIAPGTHRQCAVQQQGSIAFLASEPGTAILDGVECEGKAALVLRGREASVAGLVFRNMAVADFNGAGIRLEAGNLTVANSWFSDSQQGILTAHDANISLIIDRSTFSGLGTCEGDGGCAHSVYTGTIGRLRVTRSRFERGTGGHYLKSRARLTEVASSSFDDSAGRSTNYMIDLPQGSVGQITNNWFVQGRDKENYSAFIAVAAEEGDQPSAGLVIAGNDARFVPGLERNSVFVADWSGAQLVIEDNVLGPGLKLFERR